PRGHAQVRIPAPFLPFRNVPQPDGTPSAGLWDHHRLEWLERSKPTTAWFRFQLPESLLPVELSRARLVITVAGPVRRAAGSARRRPADPGRGGGRTGPGRDEVVTVKNWNAPVGTLPPAEILEPDLLRLDDNGGLMLGLAAGESQQPQPTDTAGSDGGKA